MKFLIYLYISGISVLLFSSCGNTPQSRSAASADSAVVMSEIPNPELSSPVADYTKWEIKDGKFYFDGKWLFLTARH